MGRGETLPENSSQLGEIIKFQFLVNKVLDTQSSRGKSHIKYSYCKKRKGI